MVLISRNAVIQMLVTVIVLIIKSDGCRNMTVNYGRLSDCLGKNGTNFILYVSVEATDVECVRKCEHTFQCLLVFYNSRTRTCSLHNRLLEDIQMAPDMDSNCYMADDVAESWVQEIIRATLGGYHAARVIGPPNRSFYRVKGNAFMEVRFGTEMYIEQVQIYEMYCVGYMKRISLLSPDGTWYSVWSTKQQEEVCVGHAGRILSPNITISNFRTANVRVDHGAPGRRQHTDAIRILGRLSPRFHVTT